MPRGIRESCPASMARSTRWPTSRTSPMCSSSSRATVALARSTTKIASSRLPRRNAEKVGVVAINVNAVPPTARENEGAPGGEENFPIPTSKTLRKKSRRTTAPKVRPRCSCSRRSGKMIYIGAIDDADERRRGEAQVSGRRANERRWPERSPKRKRPSPTAAASARRKAAK